MTCGRSQSLSYIQESQQQRYSAVCIESSSTCSLSQVSSSPSRMHTASRRTRTRSTCLPQSPIWPLGTTLSSLQHSKLWTSKDYAPHKLVHITDLIPYYPPRYANIDTTGVAENNGDGSIYKRAKVEEYRPKCKDIIQRAGLIQDTGFELAPAAANLLLEHLKKVLKKKMNK